MKVCLKRSRRPVKECGQTVSVSVSVSKRWRCFVPQLENGCLLSATNAAYIRTCLLPNRNAVVTANMDGMSTLQDHQKPGFLLWSRDQSKGTEQDNRIVTSSDLLLRLDDFLLVFVLLPVLLSQSSWTLIRQEVRVSSGGRPSCLRSSFISSMQMNLNWTRRLN